MYEKVLVKRRNQAHFCECGSKALFSRRRSRGVWRWRPDHPMCQRCWSTLTAKFRRRPPPQLRSSLPRSLAALGTEGLQASVTQVLVVRREPGRRRDRGEGGLWERRLAWELARELNLRWAA